MLTKLTTAGFELDDLAVLPANRLYTELPLALVRTVVSPLSFFLFRKTCLNAARSS